MRAWLMICELGPFHGQVIVATSCGDRDAHSIIVDAPSLSPVMFIL